MKRIIVIAQVLLSLASPVVAQDAFMPFGIALDAPPPAGAVFPADNFVLLEASEPHPLLTTYIGQVNSDGVICSVTGLSSGDNVADRQETLEVLFAYLFMTHPMGFFGLASEHDLLSVEKTYRANASQDELWVAATRRATPPNIELIILSGTAPETTKAPNVAIKYIGYSDCPNALAAPFMP